MKKILSLHIALVTTQFIHAQITFQKTYGASGFERCYWAQITKDGGYILAGHSQTLGVGLENPYLIKTDEHGDTIWTKTFGGPGVDIATNVKQTTDSGYIMIGYTGSGVGSNNMYVVRTDKNGDSLWTKTFGYFETLGNDVLQTPDGGFLLCGYAQSNSFASTKDVCIIKTDANGDTLWTRNCGGTGEDFANSIIPTADGGYLVTGSTRSFGVAFRDAYVLKIDTIGNVLWSKAYGGVSANYGYFAQQTSDTGYIIIGSTYSYGAGGTDVYLIKTDSNGNTLWSKTYGGTGGEEGYCVRQTADGGYILVGYTGSFGAGSVDVYLVKTDMNGDTLWTKTFGDTMDDWGYFVDLTADGGYVIACGTNSTVAGDNDFYLIKTDSLGNSRCRQGNTATIVTSPPTQVTNTPTVFSYRNIPLTNPPTEVRAGGAVTTFCETVNAQSEIHTPDSEIFLFPNPSQGILSITVPEKDRSLNIEIYSMLGENVYSEQSIKKNETKIDLGSIANGIYLVKVTAGEKSYCRKLVLEHN